MKRVLTSQEQNGSCADYKVATGVSGLVTHNIKMGLFQSTVHPPIPEFSDTCFLIHTCNFNLNAFLMVTVLVSQQEEI